MTATPVTSGVTSTGLTVGQGDQLLVASAGTTSATTISSGGYEVVSAGGIASATTVKTGGTLVVLPGANAPDTTSAGGTVLSTGVIAVEPDGTVTTAATLIGHTVTSGGAEYILANSIASNTVISSGGTDIVYSAGTSFGTTVVSGGIETAYYGAVLSSSVIEAGGSSEIFYGSAVSASVMGIGATLNIDGATASGTMVFSGGTEEVDGSGTAVETAVSSGGTETVYYATTSDTTIATSGLLELRPHGIASGAITFAGTGGILQIDDSTAVPDSTTVISSFTSGNSIDFDFITSASGDGFSVLGETVTVSAGGMEYDLTTENAVTGALQLSAATDGSLDLIAVCYSRGTHVLTPTGEVPIETLKIGDPLVTRFGGIQPIRWIGRQSYAARFVQTNRDQHPVRIAAGALGDRLPARDLFVSPDHSMLIGEVLILAKCLVNGVTITQDAVPEEIHYYQIEFERHDCLIAEGTWSESYADVVGLRGRFHNAAEFAALYPTYQAPTALRLCAPRPDSGPMLDTALRPFVAKAMAGRRPGRLRGSLDAIRDHRIIEGWAQDTQHPETPVLLEVLLGNEVIGTVLACDYRADLEAAGFSRGRCAFFFAAPVDILPTTADAIHLRRGVDGAAIAKSADCVASIARVRGEHPAPGAWLRFAASSA
ncbi:Hint domain-containing protein [Acidisoma cladoniae]|jgi:autotransporter passenger strand-loop-strand repeat protein|uniref:Hint domain-containing protein n=1 Tax=Acidisoma cladoniae TaxID=3040935 RepID=UPI00254FDBE7|nr:Hint domain-containing protein [Acidisoma sp. PAMC 29798]